MAIVLALIFINLAVWYPVLSFWFLGGWEQAWLIGICGYSFDFVCLMQSHGILMLFNYVFFGWNASWWYFTALTLHILVVLLIYAFTKIITGKRYIAFVVALLFGVNVAHNDVVTWGSFEGLYALLMVLFLLAIFTYLRFRVAKGMHKLMWLVISLLLFLFGLFIREVALALPFFLVALEAYLLKFKFSKKNVKRLFLIVSPFILASVVYLIFRNWYGGAPHDFIDGMVQLRISLLAQGQYLEYLFRSMLAFGRFASSHLVPYPLINEARDIAAKFVYAPVVAAYFYPFVGAIYTGILVLVIWLMRKDTKVRNLLLFSFLWFLIPTIFFSFAFTITDYELERPLVWNYTRWRYFSFFGTVLFWVTAGSKFYFLLKARYRSRKKIFKWGFISVVGIVLIVNIFFLRLIQEDIYVNNYKPAKDFYKSLTSTYKTLPEDYVFYYFPFAPGLNDRLAEFYYLRTEYYPNLASERRDWTEGHMGMVLEQLLNKKIELENVIFLDLNAEGEFLDRTEQVKKAILAQKEYEYNVGQQLTSVDLGSLDDGEHQVSVVLDPKLNVEFPYVFNVSIAANLTTQVGDTAISPEDLEQLKAYSRDRVKFMEESSVKVCKTASIGARSADAMHLLPVNMIDGNIGKRSFWAADCRPAWVILDLGSTRSVGAVAFRGEENGPNIPSEYKIEISDDQDEWREVISKKQNSRYQDIVFFPQLENARFVKFTADRTTQGGLLMLDSLEVIGQEGLASARKYSGDYEKLIWDAQTRGYPYLRFSWKSEPNNFAENEILRNNSIFVSLVADGGEYVYSIKPNEGEYYSAAGQFMSRYITEVYFDLTGIPSSAYISQMSIIPAYNLLKK